MWHTPIRILLLSLFINVIGITACTPPVVKPTASAAAEPVTFRLEDVTITLIKPAGWQVYLDEAHDRATLTEHAEPLHTDGSLNGVVVTIWLPDTPDAATTTDALHQIFTAPEWQDETPSIKPTSFVWSRHDAAYYVLDPGGDYFTLVLVVMLADKSGMVAINVSAPHHDLARVKALLPDLFDDLTLNGVPLEGAPLHDLELAARS